MTKLNKDVARETNTEIRDRGKNRLLCITMCKGGGAGDYLELRPKGTQVKYTLTAKELWDMAQQKAIRAAGL
jgi:hypothetical protein